MARLSSQGVSLFEQAPTSALTGWGFVLSPDQLQENAAHLSSFHSTSPLGIRREGQRRKVQGYGPRMERRGAWGRVQPSGAGRRAQGCDMQVSADHRLWDGWRAS